MYIATFQMVAEIRHVSGINAFYQEFIYLCITAWHTPWRA